MAQSRVEALTRQFYAWESRCRGWDAFPYPIDLEPSFVPFFSHHVPHISNKQIDEGKHDTLVSGAISIVKGIFTSNPEELEAEVYDEEFPEPYLFTEDAPLVALSVSLPQGTKIRVEETEQLLVMLSTSKYPISFEIIGTHRFIRLQFVCRKPDASSVHNQIKAYFRDTVIHEGNLVDIIAEDKAGLAIDFGLGEEFMRPLAECKNFDLDPYLGIFSVLENLGPDEQAGIQILFKGAGNPWSESILRSVQDNEGKSFFVDAPEMVKMAEEKISAPLFGVVIRIIGQDTAGGEEVARHMALSTMKAVQSEGNQLIALSNEGYNKYSEDILYRKSHRQGMLLNCKELATLVHFPSPSVVSRKLLRDTKKTKQIPEIYIGNRHVLGINIHQGVERMVTVSAQQRLKHTHIIGATGTGKSTFLQSAIIQDISNGEGLAVLDPHGDLIESILSEIPLSRHKDVILIDPSDSEFPVGFNILTAHSEIEKDILSSDLVAVFRRLSTSWGDQMNSVFANAILAFLESDIGGTLIDLRRFLIEKSFRDQFLKTVSDPSIVYYWHKEFPILKSSSIGPILTRLDSFLRPKLIRNMVAQKKSLDFEDILDSKKILLVKLSQGLMGTENSYLLGTFIVSKIQQAAMARQAKQKADRSDFFLYIDEFQNFITPSMSSILSGARKYHLGLILAHQDLQQLHRQDSELESSVIANAGTRICFRLGDTDAKKFEAGFSYFDSMDLQNLSAGEAIIRIERPENDCNMATILYAELEADVANQNKKMVIGASRRAYGTPKEEVEALLRDMHLMPEQPIQTVEPTVIQPKPEPILKPEPKEIKEVKLTHVITHEERKQETQHRYLQTLIKKMAESRGFKAITEEPTPDGKGRVDVSLERNGRKIAVEIKDTSKDEWELQNIEKCLNAGFSIVIECSTDPKTTERLQKKIDQGFTQAQRDKILILTPESLFLFLDTEIAKEASTEVRSKGYRVKVEYAAVPESEMARKRESIAKSVVGSLKDRKK